MYDGRFIFSQLMDFLPRHQFNRFVGKYQGNYRTRKFSCYDQWLCMAFAQLTYRTSLRDTITCLEVLSPKLYHVGFRGSISRSTLAEANENGTGESMLTWLKYSSPKRRHCISTRISALSWTTQFTRSIPVP